jgi:hypothetical protein
VARLPIPGADSSDWGDILNEYLRIEHNADGTLKPTGSLASKYAKPTNGIPKSHLANDVQASLTKADASSDALGGLQDTSISSPSAGQVLSYDDGLGTWVNTDLNITNMTAKSTGGSLTKADVGLGNVTNDAQLPLTGGTLSGQLNVQSEIRTYNPADLTKYVRLHVDNYWARFTPLGVPGVAYSGTVIFDGAVLINSLIRPNTNLVFDIGTPSNYFANTHSQRITLNNNTYM